MYIVNIARNCDGTKARAVWAAMRWQAERRHPLRALYNTAVHASDKPVSLALDALRLSPSHAPHFSTLLPLTAPLQESASPPPALPQLSAALDAPLCESATTADNTPSILVKQQQSTTVEAEGLDAEHTESRSNGIHATLELKSDCDVSKCASMGCQQCGRYTQLLTFIVLCTQLFGAPPAFKAGSINVAVPAPALAAPLARRVSSRIATQVC